MLLLLLLHFCHHRTRPDLQTQWAEQQDLPCTAILDFCSSGGPNHSCTLWQIATPLQGIGETAAPVGGPRFMVSLSDGTYPGRGAALGSFSSTMAAKSSMKVSFVFSAGTRPHCCRTSSEISDSVAAAMSPAPPSSDLAVADALQESKL